MTTSSDNYEQRIAERLASLRAKKRWLVADAADAIGTSKKTIYNWEAGIAVPSLRDLPRIAKAYGLSGPRAVIPAK